MQTLTVILLAVIAYTLWRVFDHQNKGSEQFEYLVKSLRNPSIKDMERYDYDSKEHKTMEHWKAYYKMMLTELGSRGWKLIIKSDDSNEKSATGIIHSSEELIFKRSSASKFYKTDMGAGSSLISDLAKEQAESEHVN
jgi:hypothetical protein